MIQWAEIMKAIVPISFLAIWALTALFNRESKGLPSRVATPTRPVGPRPTDPSMRWGPPANRSATAGGRRVSIGDDDILIIQNDPQRQNRGSVERSSQGTASRRGSKGKGIQSPTRKTVPDSNQPRLGGVSQNVNQHLARSVEMTPLSTIKPMTTSTTPLRGDVPTSPTQNQESLQFTSLMALMKDPVRLREAFVINEILQPPVTSRGRRRFHR